VPHRSPAVQSTAHANEYAERLIGSIRRECLDHVIVWNERGLRRVLNAYPERTSRSARTRRSPEPSSRRPMATSWQFPKSAVCITATNGAPRSTPRCPSVSPVATRHTSVRSATRCRGCDAIGDDCSTARFELQWPGATGRQQMPRIGFSVGTAGCTPQFLHWINSSHRPRHAGTI
jgi:hypothetical protein